MQLLLLLLLLRVRVRVMRCSEAIESRSDGR